MQAVSVEVVGDPVGDVKIPCVVHILLKSLVVVEIEAKDVRAFFFRPNMFLCMDAQLAMKA